MVKLFSPEISLSFNRPHFLKQETVAGCLVLHNGFEATIKRENGKAKRTGEDLVKEMGEDKNNGNGEKIKGERIKMCEDAGGLVIR